MRITGYGIYDSFLDAITAEFPTKAQAVDYMHELIVNADSAGFSVVEVRDSDLE